MMGKIAPRWPTYDVAPEDSVYALGVVSINYVRFERTHVWMLSAVAKMSEEQAAIITARTNASERVKLIETFFDRRDWPSEVATPIKHYLKATNLLIQNRNVLIHSNMITGTENRIAIYSLSKQGRHSLFQATLEQIRAVADGLEIYFNFGRDLANYIATEIHHMDREAGTIVVSQIPILPPLPVHIDTKHRPKKK